MPLVFRILSERYDPVRCACRKAFELPQIRYWSWGSCQK